MNLKKLKKIDGFFIFLLCFPFHFLYEWFPNSLFALFFPVNESIWEHMKLFLSSITFVSLFDIWCLKKYAIPFHNFFLNLFLSIFLGILCFLILYLPLYYKIGEKMFLTFLLLFLVILTTQIFSYFFLKLKEIKWGEKIALFLLVALFLLFGYFTYYPPKTDLFFDKMEEKYGINTYVLP